MSLINVKNLTFYYEGSSDLIFDNVSFQMDTNWKLGFAARNGRGKTTFLRLLMSSSGKGVEDASYEYQGSITAGVEFDYFPFPVSDLSKTALQIVEELYPDYEFWRLCRELSLLSVDADILYRAFETLSNGERTKVMLAVLFSRENHFLLIDEPTNHLDAEARVIVRDYLSGKRGFILVSHDRAFLDLCIDHVLVINRTNIEVCQGNFSTWWENKQRKDRQELAENERLKKDIKRLSESAREKSEWAENVESTKIGGKAFHNQKTRDNRAYIGEKSRRMQMRRKNLEQRQEREILEKSKLLKNVEKVEELKLFPLRHYKQALASFEEVRIFYGSPEEKGRVLSRVSFQIENGSCVVLQGRNGSGKSSIIKALMQPEQFTYEGKINVAAGLKISYVAQDPDFLRGSLTDFAQQRGLDRTLFLALLRKLDFGREQFEKRMENYSQGQKKKVLLAGSLCEQAHLYIWDEPLNYIDIFSRMQIEELLIKFRPTMLLVEHDKVFVDKLATFRVDCG